MTSQQSEMPASTNMRFNISKLNSHRYVTSIIFSNLTKIITKFTLMILKISFTPNYPRIIIKFKIDIMHITYV